MNIHHTKIRIGCSKLKAHIHFNLHVEDDPSCRCGFGIEDPYHFLFTCPLYAQIRVVMLDSISHVKPDIALGLSLLLRGDINLTFDQNKAIFEYVQAFIRTSSRIYSFCVSFYCNIPTYAHYCICALFQRLCIGLALLVTK